MKGHEESSTGVTQTGIVVGNGANENSKVMKTQKARMKNRNLTSLVVFIVEKQTNSVQQVN